MTHPYRVGFIASAAADRNSIRDLGTNDLDKVLDEALKIS